MGKQKMSKGKNKQTIRKGGKKQEKHAFAKKEWYRLLSPPAIEGCHSVGWVPGNKTIGEKRARDNVLGRVCEVSYADLKGNNEQAHMKVKMLVEEVEGSNLYTSFHGIDSTRETVCKVLKKKVSTIEIWCDVRTADNYILRVFLTIVSSRNKNQKNKNAYVKSSQIRLMRKNLSNSIIKKAKHQDHASFAKSVLSQELSLSLSKIAKSVHPINTLIVRKVKVVKKSKTQRAQADAIKRTEKKPDSKPTDKEGEDEAAEEEKPEETPAQE